MNTPFACDMLGSLAHEGRLNLFRLLVRRLPERVTPSELSEALGMAPSLISAHLSALRRVGLVDQKRVGKTLRYRAEPDQLGSLTRYLVDDCCRGRVDMTSHLSCERPFPVSGTEPGSNVLQSGRVFNVLFICTRNSARSLMAESIMNHTCSQRFTAYSAGTQPAKEPHPGTLALLESLGHSCEGIRSKQLDEFMRDDAPTMDFIITVCHRAANEECARWPGRPVSAHWGMPDPVVATGNHSEIALAFRQVFGALERRIATFAALPVESLDRMSMQKQLDSIEAQEAKHTLGTTEHKPVNYPPPTLT